jgi:uncharacterized membrane protein
MTVLVFVHLLAVSIWVGGFVAIGVASSIARRQLGPAERVAFFRALGRRYGVVGGAALAVALATGAALLADRGWDGGAWAATAIAVALLAVTAAGVSQARGMTRLRGRMVQEPGDAALAAAVERGARRALVLRAAIGLLTLALLAAGSAIAS